MEQYSEPDAHSAEHIRYMIYSLSREKEIYITASYALIGLSFLMIGLFALVTRKISIATGIIGMLTGIALPLFSSIIPESLFATAGMGVSCVLFFILSYRLLFQGLKRREKKKPRRKKPFQQEDI
jgi:Na+/proline symporter